MFGETGIHELQLKLRMIMIQVCLLDFHDFLHLQFLKTMSKEG